MSASMEVVSNSKVSKHFQRLPIDVLEKALVECHMTPKQLAEAIGYHDSAISGWRKCGNMPKSAALACVLLIQRANLSTKKDKPGVLVARVDPGKREAVESMLKVLQISFSYLE